MVWVTKTESMAENEKCFFRLFILEWVCIFLQHFPSKDSPFFSDDHNMIIKIFMDACCDDDDNIWWKLNPKGAILVPSSHSQSDQWSYNSCIPSTEMFFPFTYSTTPSSAFHIPVFKFSFNSIHSIPAMMMIAAGVLMLFI